jgi:hypothetical protein
VYKLFDEFMVRSTKYEVQSKADDDEKNEIKRDYRHDKTMQAKFSKTFIILLHFHKINLVFDINLIKKIE